MKKLFLERGGIGDILFRIPYYDLFLNDDSVLLCSQRDREVLDFFLPDRNIVSFNPNWFLINPLYRRQILKKIGAPFQNLVISTPYYHDKVFKIASKIPSDRKIAFMEHGKATLNISQETELIIEEAAAPAHYSETAASLFSLAGYSTPKNFLPYNFFRKWRANSLEFVQREKKVVFQPDAGVYGKRWPEENWKTIADTITPDYKISVVGEEALDLRISYAKDGLSSGISAAFREILSASRFIGNDTGFTHLAYLSGIPTVFIAGGGEYGRFCPWPEYNENYGYAVKWVFSPMDCFGCGWKCRYGDYRRIVPPCIKNISVEDVLNAIKSLDLRRKAV